MGYKTHEEYRKEFRDKGFGIYKAERAAKLEVIEDLTYEVTTLEEACSLIRQLVYLMKYKE